MKTRFTLLVAMIMISGSSVMAQGLLGKIVSGAAKVSETANGANGAATSVGGALGTAEQAVGAVNQLKGLFGGKKKKKLKLPPLL
ncbi:hypothetical protein [Mucilaginibacter antarcticus]|uniref:hypothetical protein n=1 Tax=Mucilaginibacter antarcticus TaxID=1855725 RepID=UPI003640D7A0